MNFSIIIEAAPTHKLPIPLSIPPVNCAEMYFCWRKERRYRQSLKSIRRPRQWNNKSNEETEEKNAKDHGRADCVDLAVPKYAAPSHLKRPHKPSDSIDEHNKNREDYKMLLHWVKKVDRNGRTYWLRKIVYVSSYLAISTYNAILLHCILLCAGL